jgi:hypothetical protein
MLKYVIAVSALLASVPLAFAAEMDRGNNGAASGAGPSTSEHGPGQMRGSGRNAEGGSAGQRSPSRMSPSRMNDNSSASRSDNKAAEHQSESNAERTNKRDANNSEGSATEHRNAKNAQREHKNDRNARQENMKNKNERSARGEDRKHDADRSRRAEEHNNGSGTGASEGTEGRSGGGHKGSITNVTTEQKTRVKTIFSQHHVLPARNLSVAVNVGATIPHSVHVYPVPQDIVTIVPDYSGYMYFMIDDDRVAIVDPDTYEVVDIIVIA